MNRKALERCPGCGAPLASVVGDGWADIITRARSGSRFWRLIIEVENGEPVMLRKVEEKIRLGRPR